MTSFTITHTDPTGSVDVYTSKNINTVSVEFQTPIAPMPLPQMKDEEVILIKVEGNTTLVNVSWTVIDDGTTPFTGSSAQTAIAQVAHFKTSFVPVTVEDSYSLVIGTGAEAMTFAGTLQKMSFNVSGRSPVSWEGSMQFVHGNIQVDYDEDKADAPIISTIQNKSGTNGEVDIVGIHTDYLGSDAGITHYVVAFKPTGGSSWSTVEHATTTHTTIGVLTVDINVTGSHDIKVAAKTTIGIGAYTIPVEGITVT